MKLFKIVFKFSKHTQVFYSSGAGKHEALAALVASMANQNLPAPVQLKEFSEV